jgi:hypothetical protein
LNGCPSSSDETDSQIVAQTGAGTFESFRVAGRLRDVVSAAGRSAASEFAGKRFFRALPLPESTMWLSVGRTVLEEVLLL